MRIVTLILILLSQTTQGFEISHLPKHPVGVPLEMNLWNYGLPEKPIMVEDESIDYFGAKFLFRTC